MLLWRCLHKTFPSSFMNNKPHCDYAAKANTVPTLGPHTVPATVSIPFCPYYSAPTNLSLPLCPYCFLLITLSLSNSYHSRVKKNEFQSRHENDVNSNKIFHCIIYAFKGFLYESTILTASFGCKFMGWVRDMVK